MWKITRLIRDDSSVWARDVLSKICGIADELHLEHKISATTQYLE